ncbi:MAG: hypothetical protein LBD03_05745 [Methanobrevibacter sp.]|jgi:hypothetical protein|nr:hypothetical protein [Candidatus Methanovirga procula]
MCKLSNLLTAVAVLVIVGFSCVGFSSAADRFVDVVNTVDNELVWNFPNLNDSNKLEMIDAFLSQFKHCGDSDFIVMGTEDFGYSQNKISTFRAFHSNGNSSYNSFIFYFIFKI